MKQFIIIMSLILITSFAYGADKGWNVLYDDTTGEIVEMNYGDSGYQHRIDQGYKHIKVPAKDCNEGQIDLEDYVYNKENIFSLKKTFRKRPQVEIDARKSAEAQKEKEKKIVDLEIKKEMAKKKGYTELEVEYQKQIDEL